MPTDRAEGFRDLLRQPRIGSTRRAAPVSGGWRVSYDAELGGGGRAVGRPTAVGVAATTCERRAAGNMKPWTASCVCYAAGAETARPGNTALLPLQVGVGREAQGGVGGRQGLRQQELPRPALPPVRRACRAVRRNTRHLDGVVLGWTGARNRPRTQRC
jgi:hypothetical protein